MKLCPHLATRPLASPGTGLLEVRACVLGPSSLVLSLHAALKPESKLLKSTKVTHHVKIQKYQFLARRSIMLHLFAPGVLVVLSFSLQQVVVRVRCGLRDPKDSVDRVGRVSAMAMTMTMTMTKITDVDSLPT